MIWVDSLDTSVAEGLVRFPESLHVAMVRVEGQLFLVSRSCLQDMVHMQLEHLPLASVALPEHLAAILSRIHEERLIRDISHHLCDFFPNFFVAAIYELQSIFQTMGTNAYMIGGITRDMLLSNTRRYAIGDVDILIEGNALDAAHQVTKSSRNFELVSEYLNFGTAKLNYKNQIQFDFASTRTEQYATSGALPEIVSLGISLEEDIVRRDFTVNALALSIMHPGQVVDCSSGLHDLASREIRLMKAASFFEDPSRIIRALKFCQRLDFTLAAETQFLLEQFLHWMPQVYKGGGERIRDELFSLLSQPESAQKTRWIAYFVAQGLYRLMDTRMAGTLTLLMPLQQFSERIQRIQSALADQWNPQLTWELYLSFILLGTAQSEAEAAAKRLCLTRHEVESIECSFKLLNENVVGPLTPADSEVRLYEVFHELPVSAACMGILLAPQFNGCLDAYFRYRHELATVRLDVSGDDVMHLGIPQGEQVGQLLKALLHAKLQGRVHSRLDEIAWLKAQANAPSQLSER